MEKYRKTVRACYTGYFTQAIINNLAPIFFVVFQESFKISLSQLSWLIFINFSVQIVTDIISVYTVQKIGYRISVVFAHIASTIGLILLGILPILMPSPFLGMVIAIVIYAYGSGLIEVLVSPIVDAIPSDSKSSSMSLLHSFYCWGQLLVVLLTTIVLKIIGDNNWFILPLVWAIVPFINIFNFMRVPFAPMVSDEEKTPIKTLLTSKTFLFLLLMMLCSGATELTISQWSSLFAEKGLGVPKVIGDILGPCLFALFMATGRTIYGIFGEKINLKRGLTFCGILGIITYIVTAISPSPVFALLSCALTGLAASLLWPGFLSLASSCFPKGGTALFSLMALFGDLGCTIGPYIAGMVADFVKDFTNLGEIIGIDPMSAGLKTGILTAVIFPLVMTIFIRKIKHEV